MKVGNWKYDPDKFMVVYSDGDVMPYRIGLDRMSNSSSMLDFVVHVSKKKWATGQIVSDFIKMLNILLDPQLNFCNCAMVSNRKGKEHDFESLKCIVHDNLKRLEDGKPAN